jgi:hypothetical protein
MELLTPDFAASWCTTHGGNLKNVPNNLRSFELCKIAVASFGPALKHVPNELKTREMCEIAVNQDGVALEFVPSEMIDALICELALSNCKMAYIFIPDVLKTKEMARQAIGNKRAMIDIPAEHFDYEIAMEVLISDISNSKMPSKFKHLKDFVNLDQLFKEDFNMIEKIVPLLI